MADRVAELMAVVSALVDIDRALDGWFFYEFDPRGTRRPRPGRLRERRRLPRRERRPCCCGARTRKGTPCRAKAVEGKGRCRLHGGCSTGPRTAEGRAAIAASNRRRGELRRQGRAAGANRG